jgi:hypothetical protein
MDSLFRLSLSLALSLPFRCGSVILVQFFPDLSHNDARGIIGAAGAIAHYQQVVKGIQVRREAPGPHGYGLIFAR